MSCETSRLRKTCTTAGNAQLGTAVSNPEESITYTAPAVVPTPSNIVQLTVSRLDNPKVSITQNISVLNPIPILTSAAFDQVRNRASPSDMFGTAAVGGDGLPRRSLIEVREQ
jgi:hypothetical protein